MKKSNNIKITIKRNYLKYFLYIIVGLFILSMFSGSTDSSDTSHSSNSLVSSDSQDSEYSKQTRNNIKICEDVVEDYYNNHKYMLNTYDCDNMACDVWNILQAKGIPAQIVLGNLELNEQNKYYTYNQSNHAWVVAYPSNNGGIALECTGGFISYDDKYFSGIWFDDPQEFRDYDKLYTDYLNKHSEYQASADYYNELVKKYNEQDGYTQQYMESGMIIAENDVKEKEKEFDKVRYRLEEANENLKPLGKESQFQKAEIVYENLKSIF